MRASINQTGRISLPTDKCSISLVDQVNLMFEWNFQNPEWFSGKTSVLELTSLAGMYRHQVPIDSDSLSGSINLNVSQLVEPRSVVGRLKVIKQNNDGVRFITAESKTLRLKNDKLEGEQGRSLLDVYYDPLLKSPWQLAFDDSEPILKVSNYFDNATKIYTNTVFQSIVLPEVVRQIAFWLLSEDPNPNENLKVELWWELMEEFGLDPATRQSLTSQERKDQEYLSELNFKTQELADTFSTKHKILQKLTNYLEDSI